MDALSSLSPATSARRTHSTKSSPRYEVEHEQACTHRLQHWRPGSHTMRAFRSGEWSSPLRSSDAQMPRRSDSCPQR
jgi:hypothetical protein